MADGSMDSFCLITIDRIRVHYLEVDTGHWAMHQYLIYRKSNA